MQEASSLFEDQLQEIPSTEQESSPPVKRTWRDFWESLLRMGLGESAMRIGSSLASVVMILLVVWVMRNFYLQGQMRPITGTAQAAPLPAPTQSIQIDSFMIATNSAFEGGVTRQADLHTNIPAKPRFEVSQYEVKKGDTIFGIAQKFNLKPETILWGNYYVLVDDPHRLRPGQMLNILPVDGVYYEWHAGDGLNGVAEFYGVQPDAIINWPGNQLSPESLGDLANPSIEAGTWLIVPGGRRDFISWSAPRITRSDPAVASIMGPGACGEIMEGPVGIGAFIWPTVEHYLSGYDYSPETNHHGIDIAGGIGNGIYAADAGVVVYAGWNDWGYGNVIVIDHGNGWQTLYAHLDTLTVGCGLPVNQGDLIGGMGSTGNSSGPHLHFEMLSDEYGKVNPWNFIN